MARLLTKIALS